MGGDSRLLIPSNKNVVTAEEKIGGQVSCDYRLVSTAVTYRTGNVSPAVPPLTYWVHVSMTPVVLMLQTYMYLRFPSETITRSGYQIKRKNLAVAATVKGMVYCCVAR